ncbi:MAG: enoyl-ACP reductase [Dehalococcoidia bacterium]|nr:enoyl-ACP reductase [Dehalococcoidia bacterium]MCA9826614.1 enoyl-ACP reductase [Dehalococcoidia bacterium]MCA9844611.1 enoyl-ACP reductase [Dehalococcoidia bacterium]MCA9853168.1 enoyl-ACP reductase [Dehalococcoidia bacterium]
MGMLDGKNALIFGVANDHSIAWGIAQALHREGASLGFSYAGPNLEKRVRPLAESLGSDFIDECDVGSDEAIAATFERVKERFGKLDILVHAIAFANREDLMGRFVDTSRDGFLLAHNISAYSLIGLTRAARPLMVDGGSVVTMTYYGAEKVLPNYNVMGPAKASLEATVRYLASDLGPEGIRVNAISAGPIRTLAASGIGGIRGFIKKAAEAAPLRRGVDIHEIGATAAFLCSDGAGGITGETLYVDAGYNVMGMSEPDEA